MRIRLTLLSFLATALALAPARAEDASKVDATQQSGQFTPSGDNIQTKKNFDTQPDSKIQNRQADLPGLITEPMAALGDKRSPIEVGDTFQRKTYERKEAAISTTPIAHQESPLNGQTAPDKFQTTTTYGRSGPATQYQQKLSDAFSTQKLADPELTKETTFARVNRFVFKHNPLGSDDGPPLVSPAGGDSTSAATGGTQQMVAGSGPTRMMVHLNSSSTGAPQQLNSTGEMQLLMVGSRGPVPQTLMINGKNVPISTPASGGTGVPQP